jgi:hypothetical protein
MYVQEDGYKARAFEPRNLLFSFMIAVMMGACASPSVTPQADTSTPVPTTGEIAREPMSHGLVDIGRRNL